jgi:hypothetical protein
MLPITFPNIIHRHIIAENAIDIWLLLLDALYLLHAHPSSRPTCEGVFLPPGSHSRTT